MSGRWWNGSRFRSFNACRTPGPRQPCRYCSRASSPSRAPGALALLAYAEADACELLERHVRGDWGEIPPEDANENELSVREGFRILSSYPLGDNGAKLWIITEADRCSTCLLLPEEY